MQRLLFPKRIQKKFLQEIKFKSTMTWKELAKDVGLSDRTLRDWTKGKFTISKDVSQVLSKRFHVPLPSNYKILETLWHIKKAARKGALRRQELYGLLGNIESRRKGGLVSQERRKKDPEKYRLLGCNVRKDFTIQRFSSELAEAVGIILGDGAITNYQVRVSLSSAVDKEYASVVRILMKKVFGENPSLIKRRTENTIELTLSGVNLIEELEKIGLYRGNKVTHQVDFPKWILENKEYRKAGIRGLFDTDGGLYFHRHSKWKDKRPYLGWCFCNHSKPLLNSFFETLKIYNLHAKKVDDRNIYMYSVKDVARYLRVIGSNNPKNIKKFQYYLSIRKSAKKFQKTMEGCTEW